MVIRTKGVQHVGIPVSNIERSLAWYKEMLGLEAEFVMESSGEPLSTAVNVPGADLRFGFMEVGNTIVELLEYRSPRGKPQDRHNNDVGAVHVAFEVDDIEDVYRKLCDRGVKFNSSPVGSNTVRSRAARFAISPIPTTSSSSFSSSPARNPGTNPHQ